MAVVLTALLVTAVTARHSSQLAREQIMTTVDAVGSLIRAQSPPLIAADDVWGAYTMMRATASLLPGSELKQSRAAVLDSHGRVIAASDPTKLNTASLLLGNGSQEALLPTASELSDPFRLTDSDGDLTVIDPLHSEDGQLLGFSYIEIDASIFATDWQALGKPAAIGVGLAVALLVPSGWWVGQQMTRPVAEIAKLIDRIGSAPPESLHNQLPNTTDPELGRIRSAVSRLIDETQLRKKVEQRAYSAERLAAIGRMTAAVAHEINNPLGGLLNITRTLTTHGSCPTTRANSLALLDRGLHQIQSTVTALLPQARSEQRPLNVIDFDDIVLLAKTSAERGDVDIETYSDIESAIRVPADPMRQVMLNLLKNACKAAGTNGWVRATLDADENEVRFMVANSGPAFSKELLDSIVTAEAGNDPRGFGLWVCREIAIRYDGGFRVTEENPDHTQLQFWIPNVERDETTVTD